MRSTPLALQQRGRSLKAFQLEWMREFYGPRCKDFDSNCSCCLAWMGHDLVFYEVDSDTELVMLVPEEKEKRAWYDNRIGQVVSLIVWSILIGVAAACTIYFKFH